MEEEYSSSEFILTKSYGKVDRKSYYTAKKISLEVEILNARLKSADVPYEVKITILADAENTKSGKLEFFIDSLNKEMKETNSEELELFRKVFKDNLDDIDTHSSFNYYSR